MTPRPDGPITAGEVLGWFQAARVTGATPEGVEPFALALEQWRRHRAEHGADDALQDMQRRLAKIRKAAEALDRLIGAAFKVPDYGPVLAREPVVANLAAAIAALNAAVPAPPRNRPPAEAVLTGVRMREILDRIVPAGAPKTARRRILRDALRRLGFDQRHPPGMKSSVLSLDDMARLIDKRQRRDQGKAESP